MFAAMNKIAPPKKTRLRVMTKRLRVTPFSRWRCLLTTAVILVTVVAGVQAAPPQFAEFENQIRPLLVKHCIGCHGPKKSESNLRLDSRAGVLKGGISGPAMVPGQAQQSLLIQAVRHAGDLEMPPDQRLADREIAALVRWIDRGAAWPDDVVLGQGIPGLRGGPITDQERAFWSFQPLTDPPPPAVKPALPIGNEIDHFVHAKLQSAGLQMNSAASKRHLLRRAKFDLTGLPPTPDQMQAFLEDRAPNAFAKVLDRLLDSPQYGERWGRHWLDVVRYADTAGETGDYPTPLSYKYRNWVIDAFNRDVPYDAFVRQQIAGDLLARQLVAATPGGPQNCDAATLQRYEQMMTATGFIAISRRFGFDVENYHHLTIQDTIDTLGQAVLGLTLGCARCHDHKFDPVNTNDYYAWYGIFESTRYSFPGSEEKKKSYDSFPSVPQAIATQRQAHRDEQLAQLTREIEELTQQQQALQKRLQLSSQGGSIFAGFEGQPFGTGLPEPWGTLEDLQVVKAAQSPYTNVFSGGTRGLAMPNNDANNAFGRPLAQAYTPQTTPTLHYNIDFRLADNASNGNGAFRFYMGHGPGVSGAVELSANATQLFVKNGDAGYQPVADLQLGQWYNLQITADLRTRTYSGTIGQPGKVVAFADKQFTPNWDGMIDRTFVDKYGARGGDIPARHFDNLDIRTHPHLPVGKSILRDFAELPSVAWQDHIETQRLLNTAQDENGHVGMRTWSNAPLPSINTNTSKETLLVPGTVHPGQIVVHPNTKEGVGIAWRSPLRGQIRISGKVADAHDCGDSVLWHIDHLTQRGFRSIAQGSVEQSSSQSLLASPPQGSSEAPSITLRVEAGEFLQLAIMPKANYGCDLTAVELTIEEVGGEQRVWDLAKDVQADLLAGNPHADQYGHPTWFFGLVPLDRGQSVKLGKPEPLTREVVQTLRAQLATTTQQLTAQTERKTQLEASETYGLIYGALDQDEPADAQIRIRGERKQLGDVVPRRNLEILGKDPLPQDAGSGRLQLANWLTRDSNPLTARVMANRIWQLHFGRGLVGTENDFGARGEQPSHPELLDWLASRFIDSGWSVKAMHRLIMSSAAYQQSSADDAASTELDPDARLLWRFNRRRLSAEEIRDAMLFVSGELDPTMGGAHPFPAESGWGFSQHMPFYGVYPSSRRSVYLMQQRLKRHPFLSLFDGADVNVPTARRQLTTVPTQALFLMNSEFVQTQARSLAQRILEQQGTVARIQFAYQVTLHREPTADELSEVTEFLGRYRASLADSDMVEAQTWSGFARTLLIQNEFLFVD